MKSTSIAGRQKSTSIAGSRSQPRTHHVHGNQWMTPMTPANPTPFGTSRTSNFGVRDTGAKCGRKGQWQLGSRPKSKRLRLRPLALPGGFDCYQRTMKKQKPPNMLNWTTFFAWRNSSRPTGRVFLDCSTVDSDVDSVYNGFRR